MAVVIRLQKLKHTADSGDIRDFFGGLKIPLGGVHIIGGEHEEAFVMFDSDEDGRRAMNRSGGHIRGRPVDLRLSSKSEMKRVLEESIKKVETRQHKVVYRRHETKETSLSSSQTTPKESQSYRRARAGNGSIQDPHGEVNRKAESDMPGYVRAWGMPFETIEEEVYQFFEGLQVDCVILNQSNGRMNGALVKFVTIEDAREGVKRSMQYIGSRYVKVVPATEKQWLKAETRRLKASGAEVISIENNPRFKRGPSPAYTQRYQQSHARSCSPVAQQDGRSCSPLAYRSRSPSPSNKEFCVLLENLPYSAQKRDIKELFRPADLQDDQILFLLDNEGKRTRSLFVQFGSRRYYYAALTLHKQEFLNRCVYISSIAKETMIAILEKKQQERYSDRQKRLPMSERNKEMMSNHPGTGEHMMEELPERYSRSQERLPLSQSDQYNSEKVCIYVQNLPFDVRKVEIMDFFHGLSISEDSVILLHDNKGNKLGEALVIFQTEVDALTAQSLDGQRFLGSEVLIRCLERSQMCEFGVTDPAVEVQRPQEKSSERFTARNSEASIHCRDMTYFDSRVTSDDHIRLTDLQVRIPGGRSLSDSNSASPYGPRDRVSGSLHSESFAPSAVGFPNNGDGNGSLTGGFVSPDQNYGPTCLKLVNLPFRITIDEIYDFCYGYRVVPGSVSLGYRANGAPDGSATVVFESRQEAVAVVDELSGRPIGKRKVHLIVV